MYDELLGKIENLKEVYKDVRYIFAALKENKKFNNDGLLNNFGHFTNENTVIRLATLIRFYKKYDLILEDDHVPTSAEASYGTAQLFRHCIIHANGKLCWKYGNDKLESCYKKFCSRYKKAKVDAGKTLCLSISEVVLPLIDECKKHIIERNKT